jgi:hypothetical protein
LQVSYPRAAVSLDHAAMYFFPQDPAIQQSCDFMPRCLDRDFAVLLLRMAISQTRTGIAW